MLNSSWICDLHEWIPIKTTDFSIFNKKGASIIFDLTWETKAVNFPSNLKPRKRVFKNKKAQDNINGLNAVTIRQLRKTKRQRVLAKCDQNTIKNKVKSCTPPFKLSKRVKKDIRGPYC